MQDFPINFIFAPDASVVEQWTPVGTISSCPFWGSHSVRLIFYQLLTSKSFVGGCFSVITSSSSAPAAFIVNSGTRVMACRECVKWFHQKQSTADQQAESDSFESHPTRNAFRIRGNLPANVELFIVSISCSFWKSAQSNWLFLFFILNLKAILLHSIPFYMQSFVGLCTFKLLRNSSQAMPAAPGQQWRNPVPFPKIWNVSVPELPMSQ